MIGEVKLLACPFCGNDGTGPVEDALHVIHSELRWRPVYDAYAVQCDRCTATMGYSDSEEEAIAAWNTRLSTSSDAGRDREAIEAIIREQMREWWDEICSDTGCHPLDIVQEGRRKLSYHDGHWTAAVARFSADAILALPSATKEQPHVA